MARSDQPLSTSSSKSEPVGILNFYASEGSQRRAALDLKQTQANIPEEMAEDLAEMAGQDPKWRCSRKGNRQLDVDIQTPKGNIVTLRQADTHAFWYGHQNTEEARQLVHYMNKKGEGQFPILSVRVVSGGGATSQDAKVDMEDCPL